MIPHSPRRPPRQRGGRTPISCRAQEGALMFARTLSPSCCWRRRRRRRELCHAAFTGLTGRKGSESIHTWTSRVFAISRGRAGLSNSTLLRAAAALIQRVTTLAAEPPGLRLARREETNGTGTGSAPFSPRPGGAHQSEGGSRNGRKEPRGFWEV